MDWNRIEELKFQISDRWSARRFGLACAEQAARDAPAEHRRSTLSLRGVAPAAVLAEEAVLDLRINFVKPLLCAIGPLLIHADLSL
jgi:hypothetical protein